MENTRRLNYIGSKYKLLDWLTDNIKQFTGISDFKGHTVFDVFAGTGIVSLHFRLLGAIVKSNDAELYSYYITSAMTRSVYTKKCEQVIKSLNEEIDGDAHLKSLTGLVTRHYSGDRKFFTDDNARRIDYARMRLDDIKSRLSEDEFNFLLASLIISADSVSNVPAVYGCFLKEFKKKALVPMVLKPIHTVTELSPESVTFNEDALKLDIKADIVYLDPPYNQRQYSKNYFPLNIIAKQPRCQIELKGKTGIPSDCFISEFCKKSAEDAFEKLIKKVEAKWLFVSYNNESLVPKDRMVDILSKWGRVELIERDYKRFKSFEYNGDQSVVEYLFCVESHSQSTT